jgi:ABC-type glycerol-3-phosphate transport system permease component
MAATVISVLPVMLAYLLFQKAFIRGLLGGTGK